MNISRRDVITGAVGATVGAGAVSLIGLAKRTMSVDATASQMSLRIGLSLTFLRYSFVRYYHSQNQFPSARLH